MYRPHISKQKQSETNLIWPFTFILDIYIYAQSAKCIKKLSFKVDNFCHWFWTAARGKSSMACCEASSSFINMVYTVYEQWCSYI